MGAIRHLINCLSDILPYYLLTRVKAAEAVDGLPTEANMGSEVKWG